MAIFSITDFAAGLNQPKSDAWIFENIFEL